MSGNDDARSAAWEPGSRLPRYWTWLYAPAQPVAMAATLTGDTNADLALLEQAGLACRTADTRRKRPARGSELRQP